MQIFICSASDENLVCHIRDLTISKQVSDRVYAFWTFSWKKSDL